MDLCWQSNVSAFQYVIYGVPENLNLSSIDLGSARNPGPALVPQQNKLRAVVHGVAKSRIRLSD